MVVKIRDKNTKCLHLLVQMRRLPNARIRFLLLKLYCWTTDKSSHQACFFISERKQYHLYLTAAKIYQKYFLICSFRFHFNSYIKLWMFGRNTADLISYFFPPSIFSFSLGINLFFEPIMRQMHSWLYPREKCWILIVFRVKHQRIPLEL